MARSTFVTVVLGLGLSTGCVVGPDGPGPVSSEPGAGDVGGEEEPTGSPGALFVTVDQGLDAEERVFLQAINNYRASLGVAPLQVSVALTHASEYHATDMATKNYFAHDSQDGTSWSDRIRRYYNYNTYMAENIAAGNAGGDATFTQWKNSPGHDANMKNASYRVIGIARAYDAAATYHWYWVTDFGGYVDEVMTTDPTTPPDPPPSQPANLLADGGFESLDLGDGVYYTSVRTPGSWYAYSQAGTASLDAAAAANGTRGLHVVDALTGNISVSQIVAATAGTTYAFSAWTRHLDGQDGQIVYLDFLDSAYARIGRTTLYTGTESSFHQLTRNVTAPAGAAYVRVTLYGYVGNNDWASTYDWDDVSLTAQ
jgi:uncharacterized protein YkwD